MRLLLTRYSAYSSMLSGMRQMIGDAGSGRQSRKHEGSLCAELLAAGCMPCHR